MTPENDTIIDLTDLIEQGTASATPTPSGAPADPAQTPPSRSRAVVLHDPALNAQLPAPAPSGATAPLPAAGTAPESVDAPRPPADPQDSPAAPALPPELADRLASLEKTCRTLQQQLDALSRRLDTLMAEEHIEKAAAAATARILREELRQLMPEETDRQG